jgi:hypothetical protein
MWGANRYRRGYTGRSFGVTGGHEAEAKAAEKAKKPTWMGVMVLRMLGFKGQPKSARPPRRHH